MAVTTGSLTTSDQGQVMNFEHNQFLKYKRASVPIEAVDSLRLYLDTLELKWEEGVVNGYEGEINYQRRKNKIAWVNDQHVREYVWMQFMSANKDPDWCFEIDAMEDIQYSSYKVSEHPDDSNPDMRLNDHYEWHNDMVQDVDAKPTKKCRKLSMSLILNDDYAGGSFEVGHFHRGEILKTTMPLKKGEIVVFPSQMEHRVNPILSGERKVIVAWAWGPLYK